MPPCPDRSLQCVGQHLWESPPSKPGVRHAEICRPLPGQLWRLLYLEGISLGLKPVLLSLPFQAAILGTFLSINEISLSQYLPYAPVFALLGYTLLILAAVMGAYIAGGRRIQRETIITAVKNDTL